ncbi:MAG: GtrA family protein [Candidatus Woesearchaeota archaeon]
MNIQALATYIYKNKFLRFLFTGGTGLVLNIITVFVVTEYIVGQTYYLIGYWSGFAVNMLYTFSLHTIWTFQTKKKHKRRLFMFGAYHLIMTLIQAFIITRIVDIVGVSFYLPVIIGVICSFSVVTFLIFRFLLFKDW